MLTALITAVLIAFSFKIIEQLIGLFSKHHIRFAVYYWGALLIAASLVSKGNYVYSLPHDFLAVLPLCLLILLINGLVARRSGYSPAGRFNTFNFIIAYPVLEEIAFRGLALPVLARHESFGALSGLELGYDLIPQLSLAVIITAVLFAVSHLQYYRLNAESIRFMAFALSGGLFFGLVAQATESILLTILMHISFNASAALYSYNKRKPPKQVETAMPSFREGGNRFCKKYKDY
ncbi:CPBP family intramembrane glutamic endopeptidase [Paenibacillus typhae]|uniref:CAAX protease self-immunity n=1 Tax=Paenibacillus typhae TaxID=1174501 RepID=A0A1G9EA98_9BACL|nr:CPBP family intramembrane glutamic endopeptidase [Paenibacillus typhae]SDK73057.1 CAAX protease self-immunity [Paenibacillus typhae]